MRNKKSEVPIGTIILVGLFILIFIGGIIMLLILINQKVPENQLDNSIAIYLRNIDNSTKLQLDGKYYVTYNNSLISSGDLDYHNLIEVKNINYTNLEVYCKREGYYVSKVTKTFTQVEINNNASKIECFSDRYKNLIITSNNLTEKEGTLDLTLYSEHFKKISGVVKWNSGTIYVRYKNQLGNPLPSRFQNEYDYYFETNQSLKNSNMTISLDYKAIDDRNSGDCITITLFDNDVYLINGQEYIGSEYNRENLGNPKDVTYEVCYEK